MYKYKILVYGAGAIGSIFAGMLIKNGYDVTILARGNRFEELKNGLKNRNILSGKMFTSPVKLISNLTKDDVYDYVIITVQNTQIDAILPLLSKNKSQNIVFVVNNPLGYQKWINSVGYERILIGFPSAGGGREDGVVEYFIGKGLLKIFQSTTFGELNGKKSDRLLNLVKIFKKSGFSPEISNNMDAWQKTHVAVILPIAKALYKYNCDNYQLSKSFYTIKEMILATRELFKVLLSLNVNITPGKLNFYYLPTIVIVPVFMILFRTKIAEYGLSKHTIVAKNEMDELEKQFKTIIQKSGIRTQYFDSL